MTAIDNTKSTQIVYCDAHKLEDTIFEWNEKGWYVAKGSKPDEKTNKVALTIIFKGKLSD